MEKSIEVVIESAKAIQSIAKATDRALDTGQKVGGFMAKFIEGPLEHSIGIFEDKLRFHRWERQIRLMERADEVLKSISLTSHTKPIPLKLAIPLFEAATLEDDEGLQNRWVSLLVNATNENSGMEIHRSFIEVLSQITPMEAKILDLLYSFSFEDVQHQGIYTGELPHSARVNGDMDRLNNSQNLAESTILALSNLVRLGCINSGKSFGGGETLSHVYPTLFGKVFLAACRVR